MSDRQSPGGWQPQGASAGQEGDAPASRSSLIDYLRTNRERYTREALDDQLRRDGHQDESIQDAWAALAAEDGASGVRDRRRQAVAIILAAYIGIWLVFVLGWTGESYRSYGGNIIAAIIFAVALGLPMLISVAVARRSKRLRFADTGAMTAALVVPLVFLAGITGLCLVTFPPYAYP